MSDYTFARLNTFMGEGREEERLAHNVYLCGFEDIYVTRQDTVYYGPTRRESRLLRPLVHQ